jgi:hypothetical protein
VKQREFIATLGGAAAWPLAARAQQPAVPVIAWLEIGGEYRDPDLRASRYGAFARGLSEVGVLEGRDVAIDHVPISDLGDLSTAVERQVQALLVKIKRDLENQIRGLLKNLGLVIGRGKFNVFAVRTKDDRGEPDTQTRNREQNRHFSEVTSTYPPSSLSGRQRTTFAQAGFLQVWANSDVLCRSLPA